ncbi:MAG TPA: glycosyltransferase [Symbiobacteriaceae bacterium]
MKPGLSLCLIAKDEADMLPRCLGSVAGVVDEIILVDTGSTDGTPSVAEGYGARVIHQPWAGDFAAARNAGLAEATQAWILVLDADEELHPDDRTRIGPLLLAGNVEAYFATLVHFVGELPGPDMELGYSPRLFRNRPAYRYHGRIHERLELPEDRIRPGGLRILHYGYLKPVVTARAKRQRNLTLLETALAEQASMEQGTAERPDDPLLQYYLGNEYRALGREQDAIAAYRAAKPGALAGGYLYATRLMKQLALALLATGDPAAALAEAAAGLAHFADFTDLVYLQGQALSRLGRLPEAIGAFHECLAMGPAAAPPHFGADPGMGGWKALQALGAIHERRGEREKAEGCYRKAWGSGRDVVALGRLARLLMLHKGPAAAESGLTALVAPVGPDDHLALAEALLVGHHYAAALRQAEAATAAPEATAACEQRRLTALALCRFHLGDGKGAALAFAGLPAGLYPAERLAAGLAAGQRPAAVLEQAGPGGARLAAAGCLQAGVSLLEQGLYRLPDSPALQTALAAAIKEVRRHG